MFGYIPSSKIERKRCYEFVNGAIDVFVLAYQLHMFIVSHELWWSVYDC